jgi:hypothetical protein
MISGGKKDKNIVKWISFSFSSKEFGLKGFWGRPSRLGGSNDLCL